MAGRVVIVAHPGVLGIELFGARDFLEAANVYVRESGGEAPFRLELVTHDGRPALLWGGAEVGPMRRLDALRGGIDTLIVVGGPEAREAAAIRELTDGVRKAAGRARRVVGLCTGAFILAEAGLLDGRRCTTHWMFAQVLAQSYPGVRVEADAVFVADGNVWTCGALSTGSEVLLAMIEADAGLPVARVVAQRAALALRRTGNQAQYHRGPADGGGNIRALEDILRRIAENPGGDWSLAVLSEQALMSERNFLRVFQAEVGMSPRRHVEQVRLRNARDLLEDEALTIEGAALAAGFANYQSMRRVFLNELGVTPSEYRNRFGGVQVPDAGLDKARTS